jgi:hypothetical protein
MKTGEAVMTNEIINPITELVRKLAPDDTAEFEWY